MKWRLISVAAALGLTVAIPAHAATDLLGANPPVRYAQAQQDKDLRKQPKNPPSPMLQTQQRARAQQQNSEYQRNIQRNRNIQNRDRAQLERRLQDRNSLRAQQRFDWNQYRPGRQPPDWSQHRRFDPKLWQRNFTAQNRFHWRPYHQPQNWHYRRWVFGMVLPTLFWTRDYWIVDYWMFGLMNPPYGYVWVRYGDDALLVNVQTGLILRVVYGVFY